MNPRILYPGWRARRPAWSFRRWRRPCRSPWSSLIFEGAIRKWLFPSSQDLVYFAKDVLFLLGAYAGFLRDRRQLPLQPPAVPAAHGRAGARVLLGLLQVFNPTLPNLLVGVLGFKAYFFYVPLLFVAAGGLPRRRGPRPLPATLRADRHPGGAAGGRPVLQPRGQRPQHLRADRNEDAYVATFGSSNYVRVTATFSFITGYTAYLLAMAILLLLTLLATGRWRFRGNLLTVRPPSA